MSMPIPHLNALILAACLSQAPDQPVSLEDLIRQASPAVVAIRVDREPEPDLDLSFLPPRLRRQIRQDPDLREYFKRPAGPASGLLLDQDGHVLTTLYNVGGKVKKIEILLPGGKELQAKVISRDPSDDLALLKVENDFPKELAITPPRWAGPEYFAAGRFVVAVGRSPDPAQPTATLGIISAPARNGSRVFQTDTSLNYGNVGGAILDLEGRVLGIAAYIGHVYPQWGQNSGIGFGIRADHIQKILPAMIRGEDIQPPESAMLGVGSPQGRDRPNQTGGRVGEVIPNSPAALAGVKTGDVILEFNQTPVDDFGHLRRLVLSRRPEEEVILKIRRSDEILDLKVKLGKRSQN